MIVCNIHQYKVILKTKQFSEILVGKTDHYMAIIGLRIKYQATLQDSVVPNNLHHTTTQSKTSVGNT